jgi:hypothetical protein
MVNCHGGVGGELALADDTLTSTRYLFFMQWISSHKDIQKKLKLLILENCFSYHNGVKIMRILQLPFVICSRPNKIIALTPMRAANMSNFIAAVVDHLDDTDFVK